MKNTISKVPVFDSDGEKNGKKIGTMNLVFPAHTVLPDFEELDPTNDFADPDTYNYGSEHEPDVLDVLIEREENPPEYEQDEIAQAVAVGKYEKCTGFDEYEIEDEVIFPYDDIAEPPVRTKAIITSDDLYSRDEGSVRAMYNEQNNRRRQACFTHRHYATVRGAQMAEDGFFVPRRQR